MDPYSAEGELINIHNHFHQGQYQDVVDFDVSSLSPENALPARVLQLRARVALGQADDVLADVQGETEPELEAVSALADLALGNTDAAVATAERLAQAAADNTTVQILGGTVLQAAGKSEEALALLGRHQGSCELPACSRARARATARCACCLLGNLRADRRGCAQWMPLRLLCRSISSRTGMTSRSRRLRPRGGGRRIACW
jgi:hypothetical protein